MHAAQPQNNNFFGSQPGTSAGSSQHGQRQQTMMQKRLNESKLAANQKGHNSTMGAYATAQTKQVNHLQPSSQSVGELPQISRLANQQYQRASGQI